MLYVHDKHTNIVTVFNCYLKQHDVTKGQGHMSGSQLLGYSLLYGVESCWSAAGINLSNQTGQYHHHFSWSLQGLLTPAKYIKNASRNAKNEMSIVMRKPAFCICENKDADQLRS